MTNDALEAHLGKALEAIKSFPRQEQAVLLKMVEETRLRHADIADATQRARGALDDWRVIQKYRIFDAEAKLREARGSQP